MTTEQLDQQMRRIALWGLPGAPEIDRTGLAVTDLVAAARHHRLTGVLGAVVATGGLDVDPDEAETVASAVVDAMNEVLLLEEVLLDAVGVLAATGIEYRVLKGSALAHLGGRDPAHRSFGDNDLLVRSSQIDAAVAALESAGARRPVPALSGDFDRRFAKSVTLRWLQASELDVHRTLAPGPFGLRIVLEDLWGDAARFVLAGRQIETLRTELHLLHAAYHVVLGDIEPRYGSLRDLRLLLADDLDFDFVLAMAGRWRGDSVLAAAVRGADGLGGAPGPLSEWAGGVDVPRRDRRCLSAHAVRRARFRRQALASLGELSWRDKLAFARALAARAVRSRVTGRS